MDADELERSKWSEEKRKAWEKKWEEHAHEVWMGDPFTGTMRQMSVASPGSRTGSGRLFNVS